jgi:hypothetical protein
MPSGFWFFTLTAAAINTDARAKPTNYFSTTVSVRGNRFRFLTIQVKHLTEHQTHSPIRLPGKALSILGENEW